MKASEGRITYQSKGPEYRRFLKYAPANGSLPVTRRLRRLVERRRSMKSVMYVGLAMRLFVAAVSPASGAPAMNEGTQHQPLSATLASSVHPWTSGSETSTLPWSAPRGHHQPGMADFPASSGSFRQDLSGEDARIDKIVRSVCRNC
jgi:hypothetical protein